MKIKTFGVEQWMNEYETRAKYNLGETCVSPMSLNELLKLVDSNEADQIMNQILNLRLTYGDIVGNDDLRKNISKLYKEINFENVVTTHGAIGANSLVLTSVVEPEDEVVVVKPTYQQLQSIPETIGATVKTLDLKLENNYLPDIEQLKSLVNDKTKLIILNNPDNPSGALIPNELLKEIVGIAKSVNAYVMCDEVYRHLNQVDGYSDSIVDLYDKGISTSSMSKVFSMAGLRLGWIATRDDNVMKTVLNQRDYNTISDGIIDELIAKLTLDNSKLVIARNRKIVQKNLQILDDWVNSQEHISWVKPQAGTTALLHYDLDISSEKFCDKLMDEKEVLLVPGKCFDIEHSLRIGYAFESEELQRGLDQVSDFIKSL